MILVLLTIPVLFMASRAGSWLGQRASEEPEPRPMRQVVEITPESSDFHEVWESSAFKCSMRLRNASTSLVALEDIRAGCECTKLGRTEGFVLRPSEEADIPLSIDLTQIRETDDSQPREAKIIVFGKARPSEGRSIDQRWVLHGSVRRQVTCIPSHFGFNEELVRGVPGQELEFRLVPEVSVGCLTLSEVPEGWAAKLLRESSDSASYVLKATPTKTATGVFADAFRVVGTKVDGEVISGVRIRVEGRVTERVEILPQSLDFGLVPVSGVKSAELSVVRRSGAPIRSVEVLLARGAVTVEQEIRSGSRWRVRLVCLATVAGDQAASGTVRVVTDDRTTDLPLHCKWYGVRP
jgi:hypothetical protein